MVPSGLLTCMENVMWTPTTREQHNRRATRYQTDLTDVEWRLIQSHLPAACRTGRPRAWPMREIINAIFYVLRGGITWRLLPSDFPPWPTVYRWFAALRDGSVFEKINHALVMMDRERAGREASPSAAIIDSQSVKTTEAGARVATMQGRRSKGASAMHWSIPKGGRYWSSHIRPTSRTGTAADHCYRSRAPLLPFIKHVWSDGGYNHERVTTATNIIVEIVSKPPDQVGFAVLPRRWVVERFFAWISRNRRLAKDFEATINSAATFLYAPPPSCSLSGDWPANHEFRNRLS